MIFTEKLEEFEDLKHIKWDVVGLYETRLANVLKSVHMLEEVVILIHKKPKYLVTETKAISHRVIILYYRFPNNPSIRTNKLSRSRTKAKFLRYNNSQTMLNCNGRFSATRLETKVGGKLTKTKRKDESDEHML